MSAICASRSDGHGNEKERKKVKIRIGLLLAVLSQPLWAATPKPVTLLVDDVPVAQKLQAPGAQEERNLVGLPDASGLP